MEGLCVSKAQSPAFDGLYISKKLQRTESKRELTRGIVALAKKKRGGQNLVRKMEAEGKDVFLSRGRDGIAVRVDFVPHENVYRNSDNGMVFPTNKKTLAGTYHEAKDFKNRFLPPKKSEAVIKWFRDFFITVAAVTGLGILVHKPPEPKGQVIKEKMEQVIRKDSLKNVFGASTLKDTIKIDRKIDRHV